MALTVADVLSSKPFATGKVIAGENGVTRKVEHVSVMEVDITEWFSSELVRGASLEISLNVCPWSTIMSGRWKPSDA